MAIINYTIGFSRGLIGKRALQAAVETISPKNFELGQTLTKISPKEPECLEFGRFRVMSVAEKLAKDIINVDLRKVNYVDKFVKTKNGVKCNEKSISNRCWWNKNL